MIFSLVVIAEVADFASFIGDTTRLNWGTIIGGEVTEIVSAPDKNTAPKEGSFLQSLLVAAPVSEAGALPAQVGSADIDMEFMPYDQRDPLIIGQDSIFQNQNPITTPTPEPPAKPKTPAAPTEKPNKPSYTAGPYLDGYFIFPTTGYNRGKLHAYNAIDISRGSDCVDENISVYAAASGVVTNAFSTESTARWANSGYANNILLLHPNGVITRYAHLKAVLVSVGQYVNQGALIAYMGGYPGMPGSGNSTGCHLHFGVEGAAQPFAR